MPTPSPTPRPIAIAFEVFSAVEEGVEVVAKVGAAEIYEETVEVGSVITVLEADWEDAMSASWNGLSTTLPVSTRK